MTIWMLVIVVLHISTLALGSGLDYNGCDDISNTNIFNADETIFKIHSMQDANFNALEVGNDIAIAFGNMWKKSSRVTATNNLDILMSQDSGNCSQIADCCGNVNMEQIKIGNRDALAFGAGLATNNIKIYSSSVYHEELCDKPPVDWLPDI